MSTADLSLGRSATSLASSRMSRDSARRCSSTRAPDCIKPRSSSASASRVSRAPTKYIATPIVTTASRALARKMRFVSEESSVIGP